MAYISGTISNFQSRMHQTPTGLFELSGSNGSYWLESQSYLSNTGITIPTGLQYSCNREFKQKYYQITHTGISSGMFF